MEYFELKFFGKDLEEIHGINLRETIRKIAIEMEISGRIRNHKLDGSVRAVCWAVDPIKVEKLFQSVVDGNHPSFQENFLAKGKIDSLRSQKTHISYDPEGNAPQENDFRIERSDELSEMVWALQGAGKVFASQEKIHMLEQKKQLNHSLSHSITNLSVCASENINNKLAARKFLLIVLDHYLIECPADGELITHVYDLRELCEQANTFMTIQYPANEQIDELDKVNRRIIDLCGQVSKELLKIEGKTNIKNKKEESL